MSNIIYQQKEAVRVEDLYDFLEGPEARCLIAISADTLIQESNFQDIHGSCLELKEASLNLENSIFDNSNLVISDSESTAFSQTSGITWISIRDFPNEHSVYSSIKLKQNQFRENKIQPLYGGVI